MGQLFLSEVGDLEGDLDFLCLEVGYLTFSEVGDLDRDLEFLCLDVG